MMFAVAAAVVAMLVSAIAVAVMHRKRRRLIDSIEEKPDYIVLDPPRDGINPKALEKIIRYNVPQMVYISCKPTSLARDLEVLQARGYEVKKICCVDMFPSTFHVETIVALHRTNM